jgi:hypothetical protein
MRISQARLDEAVTAVRKAAREEREQLQKELMEDMAAMSRRHAEELAAVRRREEDAAVLGSLTAQVCHSQQRFPYAYPSFVSVSRPPSPLQRVVRLAC